MLGLRRATVRFEDLAIQECRHAWSARLCIAIDMEKPDGLSIVWQSQLKEIYKSKKLSDLWGISRGWTKRLAKLNITSPSQLLDYPVQNLIAVFGKPGFYLWERVQGLEEDQILLSAFPSPSGRGWPEGSGEGELTYELDSPSLSPTATSPPKGERQGEKNHLPKSFGHSWVLNFRTTDKEKLKIVILRLAEKAARRMRRQQFVAQSVYLSVSLADGNYFGRSKRLNFLVETGLELYYEALKIWANWSFKSEVAHIAVGFASLQVKTRQLSLLPDKYSNLTPTIDLLNNKYGEFTIRSSLLAKTSDFAPDSIAFGK